LPADASFCLECGQPIGEPANRHVSPETYTPKHLAEKILTSLLARCHHGLGKLYRGTGKPGEAREHLTTATRMYHEMDMRFWLEQSEAELHNLA